MTFRLQQLMDDSSSSNCSLPPPPDSLPSIPSQKYKICPAATEDEYEFDCSKFSLPPSSICSTTVASSVSSLSTLDSSDSGLIKGWGSTLSRSRCVSNLSALGNVASETSIPRIATFESNRHEASWGYYVDTPAER